MDSPLIVESIIFSDSRQGPKIALPARVAEKCIFIFVGHEVHFIAPCGTKNPFFELQVGKNRVQQVKNIYFTREIVALAFAWASNFILEK